MAIDPSKTPGTSAQAKDLVCGMTVDPATARHSHTHDGAKYFFCSAGCVEKFKASPERFLQPAPAERPSGLVILGGPKATGSTKEGPKEKDPVCHMDVDPATARFKFDHANKTYYFCCAGCLEKFRANPDKYLNAPPIVQIGAPPSHAAHSDGSIAARDERAYVCPMCPEVRQVGPGPCPKCGMALEPESPLPRTKTEYTCPMHPEIVRPEPGSCPICGMALEPRTASAAQEVENPELVEIKAVPAPDKSGNRVNEFNMNISIKRTQPEGAAKGAAAPAEAAAAFGNGDLYMEKFIERPRHVGRGAEVRQVAAALPGHQGVQRVVQIVGPHRRAAPAGRGRVQHRAVVPVVLGHHVHEPPRPAALLRHGLAELADDVPAAPVLDGVGRGEPQHVDAEVADPLHGRADGPGADRRRARPVPVEPVAPGGLVTVREVGGQGREVVSLRAEVVVDDVERHREPEAVRPVHQALQRGRAAVRLVHGPGRDAVVAPVALARERLHRHELDAGDAQLRQVRQPRRGGVERPLRRERSDVQLVEDERLERQTAEPGVPPRVPAGVEEPGRPVHALGQKTRPLHPRRLHHGASR